MFQLLLIVIYCSFISLGLPDSLLGSAWPMIYPEFGIFVSSAGIISMIIALGTIASSLVSDKLTSHWGTGKVTAISVGVTALALLGFSFCGAFWQLCLCAIPYGLGAGSVDASLNNYVALHYESRHMSWLHCMWGVGASVGPYIMGYMIASGGTWKDGYRTVGIIQVVLTIILLCSLQLWKERPHLVEGSEENIQRSAFPLKQLWRIRGVKEVLISFFCYSAIEQTTGLWASSYLTMHRGIAPEVAAKFAGLFFAGITLGRVVSGFMTMKLNDVQMIRLGQVIIGTGVIIMLFPLGGNISLLGFVIIGLGCAPVYPCIIHCTPSYFGPEKSQAVIGLQMAGAYAGTCIMPPIFGLIANYIKVSLLPVYLLIILSCMIIMHELLIRKID